MYDTLSSLTERALKGSPLPLEFYLREHSRLPGVRANLELVADVASLLATSVERCPEKVRTLLKHLLRDAFASDIQNTPTEFVVLCGVVGIGASAASYPPSREEAYGWLADYACSTHWRVREGVALAFQCLLPQAAEQTIVYLKKLAETGNFLTQRAALAAICEPPLLTVPKVLQGAFEIQSCVMERVRQVPMAERKNEEFRLLRKTLGYTLSVVTVVSPEQGFTMMRTYAGWRDKDVTWILRENLKKKRLTRFSSYTEELVSLLS